MPRERLDELQPTVLSQLADAYDHGPVFPGKRNTKDASPVHRQIGARTDVEERITVVVGNHRAYDVLMLRPATDRRLHAGGCEEAKEIFPTDREIKQDQRLRGELG